MMVDSSPQGDKHVIAAIYARKEHGAEGSTTMSEAVERLRKLAGRLSALSPRNDQQLGIVAFTFGVIYSAAKAVELQYPKTRREEAAHAKEVTALAAQFAERGELPEVGRWLGGYFFNNTVLRLDIALEGVLRRYAHSDKERRDELITQARAKRFPERLLELASEVHAEARIMKHRNPAQIKQHRRGKGILYKAERKLSQAVERLVETVELVVPSKGR